MTQDLDVLESSKSKKTKRGLCALLQELSDDEANVTDSHPGVSEAMVLALLGIYEC